MVTHGPDGSLPADFSGSLILDNSLVLVGDLFGSAEDTTNASSAGNGATGYGGGGGGGGGYP